MLSLRIQAAHGALAAVATYALLLLVAQPAGAVLVHNGRFVFSAYTTQNHDPVNLLFTGGKSLNDGDRACTNPNQSGRKFISPDCVVHMHRTAWRQGPGRVGGRMEPRMCNGRDVERFYPPSGGYVLQTNPRSVSTSTSCRNQWHVRLWSDNDINDQFTNGQWTIGVIYREARCVYAPPRTGYNCYGPGSHKVSEDWQDSEDSEIFEMGTSTDGEPAYCTYPNYRVVPGQRPGKDGRYRGRINDGRISRISPQRINSTAPRGRKCVGA